MVELLRGLPMTLGDDAAVDTEEDAVGTGGGIVTVSGASGRPI